MATMTPPPASHFVTQQAIDKAHKKAEGLKSRTGGFIALGLVLMAVSALIVAKWQLPELGHAIPMVGVALGAVFVTLPSLNAGHLWFKRNPSGGQFHHAYKDNVLGPYFVGGFVLALIGTVGQTMTTSALSEDKEKVESAQQLYNGLLKACSSGLGPTRNDCVSILTEPSDALYAAERELNKISAAEEIALLAAILLAAVAYVINAVLSHSAKREELEREFDLLIALLQDVAHSKKRDPGKNFKKKQVRAARLWLEAINKEGDLARLRPGWNVYIAPAREDLRRVGIVR